MKPNKDILFFDFDEFKFKTLGIQKDYINQRYGINLSSEEFNGHKLEELINLNLPAGSTAVKREDVYLDLAENFLSSIDWHFLVEPYEDMPEVVLELSKKYDLITVTARQKSSKSSIEFLLNKFIPGCIKDIHYVYEHIGNKKFKEVTKKEFIQGMEGNKKGFFDDSPHEVKEIQGIIPAYLFDPTGIHDNDVDIHNRVRSWKEIGGLLL